MFPLRWPGIGLLFLRSSVALALLTDGYCFRQGLPGWVHAPLILLCVVLLAGYLTPIAAGIGLLFHTLVWLRFGDASTATTIMILLAIKVGLDLAAVVLLGPGGYSVDAYRFGRRVVKLPPT